MALALGLTVLVGLAAVGAVLLAGRVVRWVRQHRGAAADFAVGSYLSEQLGKWVDGWTDAPSGHGVPHGDGGDHHHAGFSSDCGHHGHHGSDSGFGSSDGC